MSDRKDDREELNLLSEMAARSTEQGGLKCPKCHCRHFVDDKERTREASRVEQTRKATDAIKRYRRCRHCGHRFTTIEMTIGDAARRSA